MLYLGIDQHKRQLTVNLRSEDGSVILKRQVSTQWEKVRAFFADLAEKAKPEGGFLAILEVCGMNPWLLDMLKEYGCREIGGHATHGAVETEDRPSRRRRLEPLAVGPSAAVSSTGSIRWECGACNRRRPRKPTIGRLPPCARG